MTDGSELTCVRCLRDRPRDDLDRLLWCDECSDLARRDAQRWGWWAGGVAALLLVAYVRFGVGLSDLVIGGWLAIFAATFYLVARIVREVGYGAMRFRNRPAASATPPAPID